MPDDNPDLLFWLLDALFAMFVAIVGYFVKKVSDRVDDNDDAIERIDKDVVKLQSTHLSESKIREIICAQLAPINSANREMFSQLRDLNGMVSNLRVDIAAMSAPKPGERRDRSPR